MRHIEVFLINIRRYLSILMRAFWAWRQLRKIPFISRRMSFLIWKIICQRMFMNIMRQFIRIMYWCHIIWLKPQLRLQMMVWPMRNSTKKSGSSMKMSSAKTTAWLTIFRRRKLIPIYLIGIRLISWFQIWWIMESNIKMEIMLAKQLFLHRIRDMQSILLNGSMYYIRSTKELFVN